MDSKTPANTSQDFGNQSEKIDKNTNGQLQYKQLKGDISPQIQMEKEKLLQFIKQSVKVDADSSSDDDLLSNLMEADKLQFEERQRPTVMQLENVETNEIERVETPCNRVDTEDFVDFDVLAA